MTSMPDPASLPLETLFEHGSESAPLPRASVIVPLFNFARFVTEALDSVAAQTEKTLDILVVDDSSTDDSALVACRWMAAHAPRFRRALVLRHPVNRGLAATRNTAFSRCQTGFVLPLDADNQLYPNCLQKLADSLARSRAAFAYCILERFGADAANTPSPSLMNFHPWCPEDLAAGNVIDAMALLRRNIWEEVGGYTCQMPFQGWEDYDLWFKVARLGGYGLHVPQILARYRVHPDSMLNTITNRGQNPELLRAHLRQAYPEFFGEEHHMEISPNDSGLTIPRTPSTDSDLGCPAVIDEIAPLDEMFNGDRCRYFEIGRSAMTLISAALKKVGRETCRSILDLPCGHGRIMRHLRSAFPDAMITACDLNRDAVDYCATTFDARGVYSEKRIEDLGLTGTFDLIWCGSLLTHLDKRQWNGILSWFARHLTEDGVLIFTTHGEVSARWIKQGTCSYGIPDEDLPLLLQAYEEDGFGYAQYPGTPDYGISLSTSAWVAEQIDQQTNLRLALVHERGWDNHQDVYTCAARRTGKHDPAAATIKAAARVSQRPMDIPVPPENVRYRIASEPIDETAFLQSGQVCASDVLRTLGDAGIDPGNFSRILDFGCGCCRVLRYLGPHLPQARFHGWDIDEVAIEWSREHVAGAAFDVVPHRPPTTCPHKFFDFIYGLSVFSHLDLPRQLLWLKELQRILRPDGLLLLTIHGDVAHNLVKDTLTQQQKEDFDTVGFLFLSNISDKVMPEWYQTAIYREDFARFVFGAWFEILRFEAKGMGGFQDVILLRNRPPQAASEPNRAKRTPLT